MNRITLTMLLVLLCAFNLFAQESSNKFENGLIIATKLQTIPPVSDDLLSENLKLWELLATDKKSFKRFIVDVKNEMFFGYKLEFSKIDGTNQYKLSFKPLGEDFKIPRPPAFDYTHFKQKTLSKYPSEIIVNDGDMIVLDLLENPKTKSKVQDLIKVTTTESSTNNYFSEFVEPKEFTVNNINLNLSEFKTLINKKVVIEKGNIPNSHIVGFYFRNKGKFLLSAFPQEKHNFQKVGYIENNKMYFKNDTDSFEIIAKENILPSKGKWTLWGRYTPESEMSSKVDDSLPFVFEAYSSLDEPAQKPTKMVLKYVNWY